MALSFHNDTVHRHRGQGRANPIPKQEKLLEKLMRIGVDAVDTVWVIANRNFTNFGDLDLITRFVVTYLQNQREGGREVRTTSFSDLEYPKEKQHEREGRSHFTSFC